MNQILYNFAVKTNFIGIKRKKSCFSAENNLYTATVFDA
ncbi:hypothetical protein SAMN05720465_2789 [Fibrobacter sp. UWB10]|nr:hypothetical protein SAMN05720465_2789 [Fibrobacter sp. UWB10]